MTHSVGAAEGSMMLLLLQNQQQNQADSKLSREAAHEVGVAMLEVSHIYREIEEQKQEWDRTKAYVDLGIAAAKATAAGASAGAGGASGGEAGASGGDAGASGGEAGSGPNIANAPSPSSGGAGHANSQARADQVGDNSAASDVEPDGTDQPAAKGEVQQPANVQGNAERVDGEADADQAQENKSNEKDKEKEKGPIDYAQDAWKLVSQFASNAHEEGSKAAGRSKDLAKRSSDAQFKVADEAQDAYQAERDLTKEVIETLTRRPKGSLVG